MAEPVRPDQVDDIEGGDPGLARERTDLAWTRTAISFAAVGAAMLRTSAVAGAVVMAAAVTVWGLGQISARESQPAAHRPRFSRQRTVQLVTAATTLVSAAALALALLVSPR